MLAAIDHHQLTKLSVSYVVSDDCFNYIMKRLQLVKHLEVIGVNVAERGNWANIPTGLTHLKLGTSLAMQNIFSITSNHMLH